MPNLPPFACPPVCSDWGRLLSEKWQKRWPGTKRLHDGDTLRRKDLHDADLADRKENRSSAGRPGNGRFGVRTLWVLDSLLDAAQCSALRSESIRLGRACSVLRGREFDLL